MQSYLLTSKKLEIGRKCVGVKKLKGNLMRSTWKCVTIVDREHYFCIEFYLFVLLHRKSGWIVLFKHARVFAFILVLLCDWYYGCNLHAMEQHKGCSFTYACLFGRLAIDMFLSLFLPGLPLSRFTAFSLFHSHILGVTLSVCWICFGLSFRFKLYFYYWEAVKYLQTYLLFHWAVIKILGYVRPFWVSFVCHHKFIFHSP